MRIFELLLWCRQIALILVGLAFLAFGIELLRAAYRLSDPFIFVLTFFSSNFIILISAALLIGFVIRTVSLARSRDKKPREPEE